MMADMAGIVKVRIAERGLVFDATREAAERRVCCFTSLCVLSSGAILCGFQNGPTKQAASGTVRLCESQDDGRSWSQIAYEFSTRVLETPGSLAAIELVEPEPGRLLAFATWFDRTDPARPLFDPVTEGILKSKLLMAESGDAGHSWSEWTEICLPGLRGTALTGPALRWTSGIIGVALESFKEFDDAQPGRHAAWLLISRNCGQGFEEPRLVAQHPEGRLYYWDQRLCVGPGPDEYTALFWTHDLVSKRDLAVHISSGRVGEIGDARSIRTTGIRGQIAAPFWWQGRLWAFVVDRCEPVTMALWCSADEGRTWPLEQRIIVYRHDEQAAISQGAKDIDFKLYWEDMGRWSFGHPAACVTSRGDVLLAWYAGTPDRMSVHWARVERD